MIDKQNRYGKQQGAALVVALIMLLVMTVLGVSTMSTASMELRMAANDRFSENAFQLAETGLDTVMAGLSSGTIDPPLAVDDPPNCDPEMAQVAEPLLGGSHQSRLCFMGAAQAFDIPYTINEFCGYHFENDTQGISDSQASSRHSLGMRVIGPACDN